MRQKGTVSRSADDPLRAGTMGRRPIERGQNPGERPWIILDPVGDDGQAEAREALRIAIGAEKQGVALRCEPRNDAGENRAPANLAQRLVAAAHSPR